MKSVKDTISLKEAAEILEYAPAHLARLAYSRKIKAYKRGRQWRFMKEDIDKVLTPYTGVGTQEENADGIDI